jgi:hypothetical protein
MKKELYTEHGGISMTSAQYLSNLGQEKAKEYREKFKSPVLYDTSVCLIGTKEDSPMSLGLNDNDLKELEEVIGKITAMDSFTAYVREAIKDKDSTLQELDYMSLDDYLKCTGREPLKDLPNFSEWLVETGRELAEVTLECPQRPAEEEKDIKVLLKKLPLKEYQEYLELDTKAAVLGKMCHSDHAPLVVARQSYLEILTTPKIMEGSGRDACIYTRTPSVTKENLEGVFERLQAAYREAEKELNKIRFQLREAETLRAKTEMAEHMKALDAWKEETETVNDINSGLRTEYQEFQKEYRCNKSLLVAQFEEWKISERSRISKLKIVFPESLQETYEYLECLGKEKQDRSEKRREGKECRIGGGSLWKTEQIKKKK